MAYTTQSALRAHEYERQEELRREFEVVLGGGLDARVRAGVSPSFLSGVKLLVLAALFVCFLGAVRIAVTSQTVTLLSENVETRQLIKDAQDQGDALRIERSVLSNSVRISRIAEQNYGMELSRERTAVDISARLAFEEAQTATDNT